MDVTRILFAQIYLCARFRANLYVVQRRLTGDDLFTAHLGMVTLIGLSLLYLMQIELSFVPADTGKATKTERVTLMHLKDRVI